MNELAQMWAKRRLAELEHAELARICREANEAQAALQPALKACRAREMANRRTEGPTGFVMVERGK